MWSDRLALRQSVDTGYAAPPDPNGPARARPPRRLPGPVGRHAGRVPRNLEPGPNPAPGATAGSRSEAYRVSEWRSRSLLAGARTPPATGRNGPAPAPGRRQNRNPYER